MPSFVHSPNHLPKISSSLHHRASTHYPYRTTSHHLGFHTLSLSPSTKKTPLKNCLLPKALSTHPSYFDSNTLTHNPFVLVEKFPPPFFQKCLIKQSNIFTPKPSLSLLEQMSSQLTQTTLLCS